MGVEVTVRGGSGLAISPVVDAAAKQIGQAVGSVVAATGSVVAANESWGIYHKTTLTITNLSVTVTDSGGAAGGQGTQKLYDFPEGVLQILGAMCNLTTLAATGITATAALIGSVGTVAAGAGDSTLTGTEADIIPSTAGTLTGSAGVLKGISAAPAAPFNGATTPIDAILNIAVPDAGITATSSVLINGTVSIIWTELGDF